VARLRYILRISSDLLCNSGDLVMQEIEIGTRIRVFQIKEKASIDYQANSLKHLQRPEINDEYFGENFGINLLTYDKNITSKNLHFHINTDVIHVATMVITKLKCSCCGLKSSELYPCTRCDEMFCCECQMPYNQFTQIDYDLCKNCGYADR
jgi:hypothetical protein